MKALKAFAHGFWIVMGLLGCYTLLATLGLLFFPYLP